MPNVASNGNARLTLQPSVIGGESISAQAWSAQPADPLATPRPNAAYKAGDHVGGYEILEVLGHGGMGLVLKVRNLIAGRIEAMKVILPIQESNPDLVLRFRREIQIQSNLCHPNIATMYTAIHHGEHILMLLEYIDGKTLRERLAEEPIPIADCVDYTLQLLDALSYAHQQGVVHRDINPSNVMISQRNTVKLLDFGIARPSDGLSLTQTGMVVGSFHYLSPEQLSGSSSGDARSDLFAVGILLHEILTGHLPILKLVGHSATRQLEFDPKLPVQLREIIGKAIADDPAERFQSADEFRDALIAAKRSSLAGDARYLPTAMREPWHALRLTLRVVPAMALVCSVALVIARDGSGQKRGKDLSAKARVATQTLAAARRTATPAPDAAQHQDGPLKLESTPIQPQRAGSSTAVSDKPQRQPKPLVLPEVHLQEQAAVPQTFDPPVLAEPSVLDALPAIGPKADPAQHPPAPVVLHARHIRDKLLSTEGLLTIYGREYRFRELKSDREFIGLTADLLSHCQPQKASCTVQVMASGHKESIRVTLAPELWNGREQ